ncbi:transcriptional regulator [Pseudonocardia lacus]|uniref:transcriptional regulator n=1 Tax=Pseudonocardia lacus TaxID=2835865 RepID=UPI001BDBEFC6|nr:transcriptional regulator [Pseudonocardia lacus]
MSTTPAFDEIIHAPNRLRICAALATVTEVEFATLRDMLGVADSVLSKHLKVLLDAGYITLAKPVGFGRVRTWASFTAAGRRAFDAHVAELRRLTTTAPAAASTAAAQETPAGAPGEVTG